MTSSHVTAERRKLPGGQPPTTQLLFVWRKEQPPSVHGESAKGRASSQQTFFFVNRQAGDTGDAGDTGGWNVNRVLSCSCLKAPCLCVAFSPVLFIHLCGHQPLPPDAWAAIRAEHLTQLARHTVTPHGLRVAQVNVPPFCQARAISPHHRF